MITIQPNERRMKIGSALLDDAIKAIDPNLMPDAIGVDVSNLDPHDIVFLNSLRTLVKLWILGEVGDAGVVLEVINKRFLEVNKDDAKIIRSN